MIYFDNSATTKPYPEIAETVQDCMLKYFANPSALHAKGVEAARLLKEARERAAQVLQVKPQEVVFTSGGTESNNTAVKGVALAYQKRGKHLVTSVIEHPSVQEPMYQLETLGFEVTRLPVNREGLVKVKDLRQVLREDTILVSVMLVNNEMGALQSIQEIGVLLKEYPGVLFHVDAVQGFGKVPLQIKEWGIDLLSLSAHKFHGPRGVGLLFVREGVHLFPLLAGGEQESGIRSGTENLPAIVGMVQAMDRVERRKKAEPDYLPQLKSLLLQGLSEIPGAVVNSPTDPGLSAPHIVNISFPGLNSEVLIRSLEDKGILVSTRAACSSKKSREPSQVLLAMGLSKERATSSIRISFSYNNTREEVKQFLSALKEAAHTLSALADEKG